MRHKYVGIQRGNENVKFHWISLVRGLLSKMGLGFGPFSFTLGLAIQWFEQHINGIFIFIKCTIVVTFLVNNPYIDFEE